MQVTEKHETTLLVYLLDESLAVVDGWMKRLTWRLPSSIQIAASETAPVVAINDAIWIEHHDHLKHEVLAQASTLLAL